MIKKIKNLLLAIIIVLIIVTPVSILANVTHYYFSLHCTSITLNYKSCEPLVYLDLLISLPVRIIHQVTPIRFSWEDEPRLGVGRVCYQWYSGLKIGNKVIFILKERCPDI